MQEQIEGSILEAADKIILTRDEYESFLRDRKKLYALEAGGVDNWEWYGESLKEFWEQENAKGR